MKKFDWYNEPDQWKRVDDTSLSMFVTAKTDYWRKTHYGFTVDDGPFAYHNIGGEFEAKVKITGDYRTRYDQMGLMVRKDEKHWIKTGVEYVDGKINLSAVVTRKRSDWSVVELQKKPESVWLTIKRIKNSVEITYSLDNQIFTLLRLAYFPKNTPVMVGLTAASPDGEGFQALFEEFEIKHLADSQREAWLKNDLA